MGGTLPRGPSTLVATRERVGGPWVAPAWQRTIINTEAKDLMLRHAFETLGCIRVEFKTDSLNEQSRQAGLVPMPAR